MSMMVNPARFDTGVTLAVLSLDNLTLTEGAPEDTVVGTVVNDTAGSTLTLQDDAGGRFKIVSGVVKAGATPTDNSASTYDITIRETLAGATNSPRDTVATITVSDPHFAYVVALLSGNGTNGSTTFTDESSYAHGDATVTGDAQVSTAVKKFGTGSIAFDGTGDRIRFADHPQWTLSGDFTKDYWVRFNAGNIGASNMIASQYDFNSQRSWIFDFDGTTNTLRFRVWADGVNLALTVSGSWTPSADTFYLLTAERSGDTWRLYADGVMVASATSSVIPFSSTAPLVFGDTYNGASPLSGYIDDARITNGVARCGDDGGFTPPTVAWPRSGSTATYSEPTFIAAGAISISSGVSSRTPSFPIVDVQADDIALLHVYLNDTSGNATINTPSGWTRDSALDEVYANDDTSVVFWKRCDGSEWSTSVTVTASESVNTGIMGAKIGIWRGCIASGTPYEGAAKSNQTATTSHVGPDITTTGANRKCVSFFGIANEAATGTNTNGWDELWDHTTLSGNDGAMNASEVSAPSATTVSGCTRTASASCRNVSFGLALIPA